MQLSVLLGGLHNPNPAVRLDVVRVLGMLDETRALEPLRECYHSETDENVRQAITWAGKRLFQARQAGYATVDELFQHFGIDREIENTPDEEEAALMRKMEDNLHRDLIDMREKGARNKAGWAIGVGLVGGVGAGLTALMAPGAENASSNLSGGRPQIGTTRTPATAPSNANINIWLRRLREADNPDVREQAIIQLAELNNPRALPHLAAAFIADSSPKVRQAAQRFGKILYWCAVYWSMEQDGSLAAEMERRAAAIGKRIKTTKPDPTAAPAQLNASPQHQASPTDSQEVDVGEILLKAKQARAKRKSKGRNKGRR